MVNNIQLIRFFMFIYMFYFYNLKTQKSLIIGIFIVTFII
jgi:hypothetical protein